MGVNGPQAKPHGAQVPGRCGYVRASARKHVRIPAACPKATKKRLLASVGLAGHWLVALECAKLGEQPL